MKIYKLVEVLGAINDTGKLACDMYELGKKHYYSEAQGQKIPVSEMDFQHLVRAFVKLCEQEEMLDRSENMGTVLELTTKVENLQGMLKERDELLEQAESLAHKESKHLEYWRKLYYECASTKGHYYTFSEVPQDEEGKEFVKNCRKYLNRESYKIRVKGQHLKKELYGQGKAYHGANMGDCTHMRVYIDNKRGDE